MIQIATTLPWKSRKLTNAIRDDIQHRFKKELREKGLAGLLVREHALAAKSYDFLVEPRHQERMKQLPEDFFEWDDSITLPRKSHSGHGYRFCLKLSKSLPIPKYAADYYGFQYAELSPELEQEVLAFSSARNEANKCIEELVDSVNAVLRSVTTEARLIEVWPEGFKYLLKPDQVSVGNLPATQIPAIQDMINQLTGKEAPAECE